MEDIEKRNKTYYRQAKGIAETGVSITRLDKALEKAKEIKKEKLNDKVDK